MSRLSCLFLSLLAAAVLPHVAAHGFVQRVMVDGTLYEGNIPGQNQGVSPIRTISTIDPVKGASNPNLNCGQDAQIAAFDAPAAPGSNVSLQWVGGATGSSNWIHAVGPIMTYMASCGGASCTAFNGSGAQWFKVAQAGQKPGGSSWYQGDITTGDAYSFVIPDLAPGGYLIRNELIALQLALTEGGAEFYPSCTQVRITGSASGTPSATVAFPGAYTDTDAGILTPNVYNPGFQYVFPGPALSNMAAPQAGTVPELSTDAAFVSGGASPPASTGSAPAAPSASASPSAPAAPASSAGAPSASAPAPASSAPAASAAPSAPASSAAPSASASAPACKLHATPSPQANATSARRAHGRMMRRLRHTS